LKGAFGFFAIDLDFVVFAFEIVASGFETVARRVGNRCGA
jgi:hypothetical protein